VYISWLLGSSVFKHIYCGRLLLKHTLWFGEGARVKRVQAYLLWAVAVEGYIMVWERHTKALGSVVI